MRRLDDFPPKAFWQSGDRIREELRVWAREVVDEMMSQNRYNAALCVQEMFNLEAE